MRKAYLNLLNKLLDVLLKHREGVLRKDLGSSYVTLQKDDQDVDVPMVEIMETTYPELFPSRYGRWKSVDE